MPMTNARHRLVAKLAKLATVTHVPEPEDDDPVDHFGYDTEAQNREAAAYVRQLADRTEWGWCVVKTTATYADFSASVYLGGCSYLGEEDFIRCDDGTQVYEACAALLDKIIDAKHRGQSAAHILTTLHAR